eukprot:TRINITY_DN32493_c0_g1_i1.p2 TRINITY_DN32493_c0_g1~~TRINITY_DN32493_c0_g1_i1.p2  ORF type:complete len:121 (-),score=21.43 TRINITY_DN32493_c0_g1_i1:325-687(-)
MAYGRPVQPAMPWMVFIHVNEEGCAGTLINSQFVLTSASCFCNGQLNCTRDIGDYEDEVSPIQIQDDSDEIAKKVKVYMGTTHGTGRGMGLINVTESKDLPQHVEKILGKENICPSFIEH